MRKLLNVQLHFTIVIACCISYKSTAQNTFPASGNVGIGTTSPSALLQVTGGDAYINGVRVGRGNSAIDSSNTCFGRKALENMSPSQNNSSNTAIGNLALRYNTTGTYNTAVGDNSLKDNTASNANVAIGPFALTKHTTGDNNIAIGKLALALDNSGEANIGIGTEVMSTFGAGSDNVAIGHTAMKNNASSSGNVAVGSKSLYSSYWGDQNTAIGNNSVYNNTTGDYNTAIGGTSLYNNTSGLGNSGLGHNALTNNTTGDYNTGVGFLATTNTGALNNTTAIGYNARTTASNQVRIGNSSVSSIGGYAGWTNVSDGRIKRNIKENVPGLSFINQLKPVTYNLNLDEADKIIGGDTKTEIKMSRETRAEINAARQKKQQVVYTGFIAQDVERAAKKLDYDFSGIDMPVNDKSLYGLRYAEFVVPLVKSVQELSRMNEEKDKKINDLQKQIDELREFMLAEKLKYNRPPALLEQNVPNPLTNTTTIAYSLPPGFAKAKIIITDKNGRLQEELNISGSGKGSVNVNTTGFETGTYQYSLFINNQLIDTKQMLIVK